MSPSALLLGKALVGGIGVIAFAAVARVVRPHRLAGLFCAAPSVAIGSLAIVVLASGEVDGLQAARGMVLGAVALLGACLVGAIAARPAEASALPIATATGLAWLVLAALLALVVW